MPKDGRNHVEGSQSLPFAMRDRGIARIDFPSTPAV
jgi:hypothetical protein